MIGGYSFERSEFNRAIQACRQPGSSFKPIVYSAAIALNNWNASTTILDAPLVADDPAAGRRWKPKNFEQKFLGEDDANSAQKLDERTRDQNYGCGRRQRGDLGRSSWNRTNFHLS